MPFSAVQHERKPMLDKKETPASGTAANVSTSIVTGNSLNSSGSGQTGAYSQNRVGQKPGFWRGDFASNQNDNSNISNMFPVNFSFAELTSTLAQRGSEYNFILKNFATNSVCLKSVRKFHCIEFCINLDDDTLPNCGNELLLLTTQNISITTVKMLHVIVLLTFTYQRKFILL